MEYKTLKGAESSKRRQKGQKVKAQLSIEIDTTTRKIKNA
jgi:hypothetical protein